MGIEKLGPGDKAPNEFYVIIEIAAGGAVKYEVDKDTGMLMVDRFMNVSMHYPANYGFVPKTLAGDGDPTDVLVLTPFPIVPGCAIKCRAIAVLDTEDEKGTDAKILAVPTDKVSTKYYQSCVDLKDVPQRTLDEISHFYERYKDLEDGKWVKVKSWRDAAAAREEIAAGMKAHKD